VCEDELAEMVRECRPSFIITDAARIDRVQFVAATRTEPSAANVNVGYII